MNQTERRVFLIRELLREQPRYGNGEIPSAEDEQKALLRGLMNVRAPGEIGGDFLRVQDEYLQEAISQKGITDLETLTPAEPGLYLWQGDITTLRCDAIVNAANSGLTGCYQPNHACIDNCIHTFGGVQMRRDCARLMAAQGHEEPTGQAKITNAYNLPCKYVLHTVGPIVGEQVTARDRELLVSCYRACLTLAAEHNIKSVAFCSISTGVFRFPKEEAAQIAVDTVRACRREFAADIEVIFNVFSKKDYEIYRALLG